VRTTTRQQIDALEIIKQNWADIGVDLYINSMDSSLYRQRQVSNDYDAVSNVGAGGLYEIINARQYLPVNESALYGIGWARWLQKTPGGVEPPPSVKRQFELYKQVSATVDPAEQQRLFRQILDIARDEFRIIGISLQSGSYAIVSNRMGNVPSSLIDSAIYPTPAPANISTWFVKGPRP